MKKELEKRVDQAVDNFMQGYGCCQSVVAAFADLYGLDETMAKRIAAGFGGGVGRMPTERGSRPATKWCRNSWPGRKPTMAPSSVPNSSA